jgi:hypothetical protein
MSLFRDLLINKKKKPYKYKVEYLESNTDGTASKQPYIDTEIYLWGYDKDATGAGNIYREYDVRYDVTFQVPRDEYTSYGNVFGTRQSGNTNEWQITEYSGGCVSIGKRNMSLSFNDANKHRIYSTSKTVVNIDGTSKTLSNSSALSYKIGSFVLFAIRQGGVDGSATQFERVRIYRWKIEIDGVVLGDFIPVIDNNDVPCMYDTVRERLFYNAGNGSFIAGSIIS